MTTFTVEQHKSKRSWVFFTLAILLIGLNIFNGIGNYLDNKEIFLSQGVSWVAVWGQAGLLWSVLFFPFLITIRAGSLTRMEHEQANWRRMASYGALAPIYRGKLILLAIFVLSCQTLFVIGIIISSLALGFRMTFADISAMICWSMLGAVGGMTIATIQVLVGILVPSFATTVAIGLIGSLGSLVITLITPVLASVYPYSQISVGMRIRTLDWPATPEMFGFLMSNTVLVLVTVILSRIVLGRKEH